MITAANFIKAQQVEASARLVAAQEMPNSHFVLVGVDNDFVYFDIVCKMSQTTPEQIRDIVEKTQFQVVLDTISNIHNQDKPVIYQTRFKVRINL